MLLALLGDLGAAHVLIYISCFCNREIAPPESISVQGNDEVRGAMVLIHIGAEHVWEMQYFRNTPLPPYLGISSEKMQTVISMPVRTTHPLGFALQILI